MIGTYKTGTLVDYNLSITPPTFYDDKPITILIKNKPGQTKTIKKEIDIGSGYPIGANWYSVEGNILRPVVYRLNTSYYVINKDGQATKPSIIPPDPVTGIGGNNPFPSDKTSSISQNQLRFPKGVSWVNTWDWHGLENGWTYIRDYHGDPIMKGNVEFITGTYDGQTKAIFNLTVTKPISGKLHKLLLEFNTTHGNCFSEIVQISGYNPAPPELLQEIPSVPLVDFDGAPSVTLSSVYSRGTGDNIYYEITLDSSTVIASGSSTNGVLSTTNTQGFSGNLIANNTTYIVTATIDSVAIDSGVIKIKSWTEDGEPTKYTTFPSKKAGWILKDGTKNAVREIPLNLRAVCLTHGITSYNKQDYIAPLRLIKNPNQNWGYILFRQLYFNNTSYKYNYQSINVYGENVNVLTDKANVIETYEYWSNTDPLNPSTEAPLHLFYLLDLRESNIEKVIWYKNNLKINESVTGNTEGRIRQQTAKNDIWVQCKQWDVEAPYGVLSSTKITDLILNINSLDVNNNETLPVRDVWNVGLVFDNVTSEDVGVYTCEVQTTSGGVLYNNLKKFYVDTVSSGFRNKRLLYDRKCNLIGAGTNFTTFVQDHATLAKMVSFGDGRYGQKGWTIKTLGKYDGYQSTKGPSFKYTTDLNVATQIGTQNIALGRPMQEVIRSIYIEWPKYVDTGFALVNGNITGEIKDPNVTNFTWPTIMEYFDEINGLSQGIGSLEETRKAFHDVVNRSTNENAPLSARATRLFTSVTCGNAHQAGVASVLNRYTGTYVIGNNEYGQLGHSINSNLSLIAVTAEEKNKIKNYSLEYKIQQIINKPNDFPPKLLEDLRRINKLIQTKNIPFKEAVIQNRNFVIDKGPDLEYLNTEDYSPYDSLLYNVFPGRDGTLLKKVGGVDEWEGSTITLTKGKIAKDVKDYDFSQWDYILNPPTITVAGGNQTFSYKPNTPFVYALGQNHYGQLGIGRVAQRSNNNGGKDYLKEIESQNQQINIKAFYKEYTYKEHELRPAAKQWRYYWNDCLEQDTWELNERKSWYPKRSDIQERAQPKPLIIKKSFDIIYDITQFTVWGKRFPNAAFWLDIIGRFDGQSVYNWFWGKDRDRWQDLENNNYMSWWYVVPCTTGMTTTVVNYAFEDITKHLPSDVLQEYDYVGPRAGKNDPSWFRDYPAWPGSWSQEEWANAYESAWPWGEQPKNIHKYEGPEKYNIWAQIWGEEKKYASHFQLWKSGFLPESPVQPDPFEKYNQFYVKATREYDFSSRPGYITASTRVPCTRVINIAAIPFGITEREPDHLVVTTREFISTQDNKVSIPGHMNVPHWGLKLLGRPRLDVIEENYNGKKSYYIGDEILYKWWLHPEGWTIRLRTVDYSLDVITNDDIFGEFVDFKTVYNKLTGTADYLVTGTNSLTGKELIYHAKLTKGDANSHYPHRGVYREPGTQVPIGIGMKKIFNSLVRYLRGERLVNRTTDSRGNIINETRDPYYTNKYNYLSLSYNRSPTNTSVKMVSSQTPTTMFNYPFRWRQPLSITLPADPMRVLVGTTYRLPVFTESELEYALEYMWFDYERKIGPIKPSLFKRTLYNQTPEDYCLYNIVSFDNKPFKWTEVDKTQLQRLSSWPNITKVSPGPDHTLFLTENGSVYGCGNNEYNQLGKQSSYGPQFTIRDEGNGVSSFVLAELSRTPLIWSPVKVDKNNWITTSPESYSGLFDLTIQNIVKQTNNENQVAYVLDTQFHFNPPPGTLSPDTIKSKSKPMPRYYFKGSVLLNNTQLYSDKECTKKAHSLEDDILGQACPALFETINLNTFLSGGTSQYASPEWDYNSFLTPWTPGYVGIYTQGNLNFAVFITNWFGSFVKDNHYIIPAEIHGRSSYQFKTASSLWSEQDNIAASNESGRLLFYSIADGSKQALGEEIVSLPKLIHKADESPTGKQFLEISAGKTHSLFLNKDHTVWYLGAPYGEMDNVNTTPILKQVKNADGTTLTDVVNIKAGWGYSLYMLSDGRVKIDGVLGDWDDRISYLNTYKDEAVFSLGGKFTGLTNNKYVIKNLRKQRNKVFKNEFVKGIDNNPITNIIDLAAGANHCVFYQMDLNTGASNILAMGSNKYGQCGLGTLIPVSNEYFYKALVGYTFNTNQSVYVKAKYGYDITKNYISKDNRWLDPNNNFPLHPLSGSIFIGEKMFV